MAKLGTDAFAGCSSLSSVTLSGDSFYEIGYSAFWNCHNLKSVVMDTYATILSVGGIAFYGCEKLSSITCTRSTAPYVQSDTFGYDEPYYTGYNSRSSGNNVLKVPQGATGYDSGVWLDPFQDATKCGFHIEYI